MAAMPFHATISKDEISLGKRADVRETRAAREPIH